MEHKKSPPKLFSFKIEHLVQVVFTLVNSPDPLFRRQIEITVNVHNDEEEERICLFTINVGIADAVMSMIMRRERKSFMNDKELSLLIQHKEYDGETYWYDIIDVVED